MNTSEVTWQRNKFQKFFAQMKIRVGGAAVPVDIQAGDEFLFDGTILKYGGTEFTSPQTRGAINAGWATKDQGGGNGIQNHSSNRSVAKATSVNRDLSKVQRTGPSSMQTDMSDEDTVMNVSDRREQNTGKRVLGVPNDKAAPRVMTAGSARGMQINSDTADGQEGVSVGRVRTAAKVTANVLTNQGAQMASKISNIAGSGFVPEGEDRPREHNVIQREGITVRTNTTAGRVSRVEMSQDDEGSVVGKVRRTRDHSTEGVTVTDTSNIREERARSERAPRPQAVQKPAAKTLKVESESGTAAKIKTAKTIDPKFPDDWNFFAKLPDRLAIIKKNEKNRKFLLALFVVEGASVRAHLQKTYPKIVS
jgi:hypothetical protein